MGKTTEIASPTITRWIKTVIVDAHRLVKDQDIKLEGVKAHQVPLLWHLRMLLLNKCWKWVAGPIIPLSPVTI